jgi:ubiquinone/menaquinone biosynthesis C-methylase UbiE
MNDSYIFTLFEGLDRQGPGSDACTIRMFDLLAPPVPAAILDIGCGTGSQTLALARRCPECTITAVDIHQPYLDSLRQRAERAGSGDRITTLCASMDDLPVPPASFDVIWAEGSIFVIGFEKGLRYWKQFLRPGGSMALTEMVWFTDHPSDKAASLLLEAYPPMTTVPGCERMIREAGYHLVGSYRLPDEAWWKEFYDPLERKMSVIEDQVAGDPETMAILDMTRKEIAMFRQHSGEYGYQAFLLRKGG